MLHIPISQHNEYPIHRGLARLGVVLLYHLGFVVTPHLIKSLMPSRYLSMIFKLGVL